ncbi:hypothetical protein EV175_000748 [Coemansia sp. RSA 1933]|nr:hypothetical protein EV175_000748 [Coemansia sp. RSA 1933]
MAIKPISPAIQRNIDKVEGRYTDLDLVKEIERYRFTATEIYASLPEHIAGKRRHDLPLDNVLAGTTNRESVLKEMHNIRNKRAAEIMRAFTVVQLREYLRLQGLAGKGNKPELVNRIIQNVWRITTDTVTSWFDEAHKKSENQGMSMELGKSALEHLVKLDRRIVEDIERDHKVKVTIDKEGSRIDISGKLADARVALSNLREMMTAQTTVEIDRARYGVVRGLSDKKMRRIVREIEKTGVGRANSNITYSEGELFVNGMERLDVRDTCDALVQATVEPANTAAFVVVPGDLQQSTCTVVPAADMLSMRETAITTRRLFALGEQTAPDRESAFASHSVYCKEPLGPIVLAKDGEDADSVLMSWAKRLNLDGATVVARLGGVMLDLDTTQMTGDHRSFSDTSELMDNLGKASPLFAFASHVSHMDWFHRSPAADKAKTTRELVLKFARIKEPSTTEQEDTGKGELPVYEDETIAARISISEGKLRFGQLQLEHSLCEPTANIAFLQARYDVQLSVRSVTPVPTTRDIVAALKDVSHKLGISGIPGSVKLMTTPRRHHVIDMMQGKYGLLSADLVGSTGVELSNGYRLNERQVWSIISNQQYNEAEVIPLCKDEESVASLERLLTDGDEWRRFVVYLFEMAYGRRLTPASESTELFV